MRDVASTRITHAADKSVAAGHFPFGDFEQVHRLQADVGGVFAELFEGNFLIAPAGNRLLDVAFARDGPVGLRPRGGGNGGHSGPRKSRFQHVAAREVGHGFWRAPLRPCNRFHRRSEHPLPSFFAPDGSTASTDWRRGRSALGAYTEFTRQASSRPSSLTRRRSSLPVPR